MDWLRSRRVRPSIQGRSFARRGPVVAGALAVAFALLGASPALARAGQISEFPLSPPGTGPLGIAEGSDGALWFTESGVASIGRFGAGGFGYFPLPGGERYASDIVAGPDGALWFTEPNVAEIGRIATNGKVTDVPIPPCGCGPYGQGASSITAGPDGALWYARFPTNVIGRVTTSGAVTEFPAGPRGYGPSWITSGPDDALWFTNEDGVDRMNTDGVVTHFRTPFTYPSAITTGPDGNLWVTFPYSDVVARVTPSGDMKFFSLDLNCSPQQIASGAGALWVTCYFLGEVERVSTSGTVTRVPVPSGATAYGITLGPGSAMWFTEDGANSLGRISTR